MSWGRLNPIRVATGVHRRVRTAIRAVTRPPQGYSFLPAPSIDSQAMTFRWRGRTLRVESGYTTPLYETIAEVVDYDCYQLRSIEERDLAGTTLVDIGANIGITALCLAQVPGASVLCFEPDPRNQARLQVNLQLNDASNVTIVPKAVARANGVASFRAPQHEDVGGRLLAGPSDEPEVSQVPTVDLATALEGVTGRIGLMKVDCEGGEYDIVEQITPALAVRLERLTFEVHDRGPGRNFVALSRRLEGLGYALTRKPDPFGRESLDHLLAVRGAS